NSGTHEYVNLPLKKLPPYFGYLVFRHLTVSYTYSRVRYALRNLLRAHLESLDAVVDIVYLTASAELLLYRLNYYSMLVLYDIGLNRISVRWRLFYHRHVPYSAHSHVERARYRSGGKSKYVHRG